MATTNIEMKVEVGHVGDNASLAKAIGKAFDEVLENMNRHTHPTGPGPSGSTCELCGEACQGLDAEPLPEDWCDSAGAVVCMACLDDVYGEDNTETEQLNAMRERLSAARATLGHDALDARIAAARSERDAELEPEAHTPSWPSCYDEDWP